MERLSQRELIARLNDIREYAYTTTFPQVILDDTIWGLHDGVYKPLGELQLPIMYANGEFPNNRDKPDFKKFLTLTIFDDNFFQGDHITNGDQIVYIDDQITDTTRSLLTENDSDYGGSSRQTVQEHLTKFFDIFKNKEADKIYQGEGEGNFLISQEERNCITRSFIPYE